MFTDVEMAILSQAAYCEYPPPPADMHEFLLVNKKYLSENLGEGYADALQSLLDKTEQQTYTIVMAKDDEQTGFAAFAVEGPGNQVATACRGTEFDQLFSEETKTMVEVLNKFGINDLSAYSTAAISSILVDYGFTGDGLTDVLADIELAFAKNSAQQKQMESFVDDLEQKGYDGYFFTGHSLGGNVALHGAISLRDPSALRGVVTYNAPGYNEQYLQEHQRAFDQVKDRVTLCQNKRDAISEALIPPGNVVVLDCKDPKAGGIEAHSLNQLVVDDSNTGFTKSKKQTKEQTFWGAIFGTGGVIGNWLNESYEWVRGEAAKWGGTEIRVPLSTLQENARIMQDLTDTNADIFDRVNNSLLCLRENKQWKGLAVNNAIQATEQNKARFAQTVADMKELADFLRRFTDHLEAEDTAIQNRINAI